MLVVVLHFILDLYFVVVLHLSFFFTFSFRHHPSPPFRGLSLGFYTHLNFQPSPSQSDSRHFHFQPFHYILAASATALSGQFFTHMRFLPCAPSATFYPAFFKA